MKKTVGTSLRLNKFDVAERQLNQAIKLFFDEEDVVSIHTLAEASCQILYDLRHKYSVQSFRNDSAKIRDEYKKHWLTILHKPRNFFKHADRDCGDVLDFKEVFNHFPLLDAVCMYTKIKASWTPESLLFVSWFFINYPHLLNKDKFEFEIPLLDKSELSNAGKATFGMMLKELRIGHRQMRGLVLSYGLPDGC
jgi:hypothetical protein